jgi:DNA-binding PadR family transcriptional regulator
VAAKWGSSESGRRRKYYRLTDQGRAELAEQRRQWAAVVDALRGVWTTAQPIRPIAAPMWEAGR